MYSKDLEELIESVLADGVITDTERNVLRKRAEACGEDPDEVIIVVEGRLAKINKTSQPEKRGNIVKCPNCGAPIQAGAVRCEECGYVFTNVQAISSAKEFAELLDKKLSQKKVNVDAVKEFIKNFPIPAAKEDMLEFMVNLDVRRRNESDYQDAYNTKFKECANKATLLFKGDPQVEALIKRTKKSSLSLLTRERKSTLGFVIFFVILGAIIGIISITEKCSKDSKKKQDTERYEIVKPQIDQQYEEICQMVDELPLPTKTNYDECALAIKRIQWKQITNHETDGHTAYYYESDIKEKAADKVNGYIQLLHTIEPERIGKNKNPKYIYSVYYH